MCHISTSTSTHKAPSNGIASATRVGLVACRPSFMHTDRAQVWAQVTYRIGRSCWGPDVYHSWKPLALSSPPFTSARRRPPSVKFVLCQLGLESFTGPSAWVPFVVLRAARKVSLRAHTYSS